MRQTFKMVVQYLSCETYVYERRFALPRESRDGLIRGYKILRDEGLVGCFFCDKKDIRGSDLNRWAIPKGARKMEFLKKNFHGEFFVGAPVFYDIEGNLLKIGNR